MPLDSGLKLCEEAVGLFGDMKLGSKTTRYMTLKLNAERTLIDVESTVAKSEVDQKADYDAMVSGLTKSDGRFILMDLEVTKPNGSLTDQLFCIMWNPDDSGAKTKMLYASALGCVVNTLKLNTGAVVIQANDFDEMSYELLMVKGKK